MERRRRIKPLLVFVNIILMIAAVVVAKHTITSPATRRFFAARTSSSSTCCSAAFLATTATAFHQNQRQRQRQQPSSRNQPTRSYYTTTTINMSSSSSSFFDNTSEEMKGRSGKDVNFPDNNKDNELVWWRTRLGISSAKSRKIRGSNYVQISSVSSDGQPRCRTVVFRGFQSLSEEESKEEAICMKMITDARSSKVTELTNNPIAELVWWFPKSNEQYRVRGNIQFVGDEENFKASEFLHHQRKQLWGNLSDPAREQFYWNTPGKSYEGEPDVPTGGRDSSSEENKVLPPPSTFLLMLLHPTHVDYLRLGDNYHQRDVYDRKTQQWIQERINP